MQDRKVTIVDIARVLGLSKSTVSRAIGHGEMCPETRKTVLDYVNKIGFHRNENAYLLRKKRSFVLGIVVTEINNHFFSQIINGVEKIASDNNYHVVIAQSNDSAERESSIIDHLVATSIDGLLISLSTNSKASNRLKFLQEKGLPIVSFDRTVNEFNAHTVKVDNYKGAYAATEYLIKKGNKSILHITNSLQPVNSQERFKGYIDALMHNHINFDSKNLITCQAEEDMNEKLKKFDDPEHSLDAIFIAQERLTTITLLALKKSDFPFKNTSIAGFTNSPIVDLFAPPITTIYQPAFEIGKVATELIIELINSKEYPSEYKQVVLDTKLCIRE